MVAETASQKMTVGAQTIQTDQQHSNKQLYVSVLVQINYYYVI